MKYLIKNKQVNNHYYGLDLLRGVSGYGVAICHFYAFIYSNIFLEYLSFIFVEFFFVLSGFVLFPQLLQILNKKKNLLIFYKRRWLRTLPLYFICLVAVSLMFNKFLTLDFFKYFFFIQDLIPNFIEVSYFPVVWSLSIEEFFYLFFPVFLLLINKKNFLRKIIYLFFSLILIKIFISNFYDSNFLRTGTLLRFDAILLGFILRYVYINFNLNQSIILSVFFLLIYIFLQDFILSNKNLLVVKIGFVFLLQILSSIILIFFLKIEFLFKINFFKKFATLVARQTYSVYLTHMILIYALINFDVEKISKLLLYLFLLIAISTISYYFVEKPILKTRPKYL